MYCCGICGADGDGEGGGGEAIKRKWRSDIFFFDSAWVLLYAGCYGGGGEVWREMGVCVRSGKDEEGGGEQNRTSIQKRSARRRTALLKGKKLTTESHTHPNLPTAKFYKSWLCSRVT